MNNGWISLHRKIFDNSLYFKQPFNDMHAWIDLLLLANTTDAYIWVRGNNVLIKRGQVGWSVKMLAKRWRWSRGKVQRFLDFLEKMEHQIEQQKSFVTSIITIVNYNQYQKTDSKTDSRRTADGQQTDTNNKDNKDNNIKITQHFKKNVAPESPEFEKAWTLYPARNGKKLLKAEAKASFLKIKETDVPLVLIAIQNYASSQGAQDGFAKDMVRFLRNDRWREWLTMEIVQEITKKEPYPGGASIPWRSEQSPHPKPADPELVKQTLSEIKKNLYHEKQSIQKILPNNHKPIFIAPTQNELLLAEKKKIDNRKRLIQLYGNHPS